jgi:hypothetical protein
MAEAIKELGHPCSIVTQNGIYLHCCTFELWHLNLWIDELFRTYVLLTGFQFCDIISIRSLVFCFVFIDSQTHFFELHSKWRKDSDSSLMNLPIISKSPAYSSICVDLLNIISCALDWNVSLTFPMSVLLSIRIHS